MNSSWDFNNTWGVIPGVSYPYPKLPYEIAGGAPIVFSGETNAANQVLFMIWATAFGPGIDFFSYGNTVTGANGSFYITWANGSVIPKDIVILTFTGGNTQGSVTFKGLGNPSNPLSAANLFNIPVTATFNNNPANSNTAFYSTDLIQIYAGTPLNHLLNGVPSIFSALHDTLNLVNAVNALYNFNSALYVNQALYYQSNLDEEVKKYYSQHNMTLSNINDLLSYERFLDRQLLSKYDIKQISPAFCAK